MCAVCTLHSCRGTRSPYLIVRPFVNSSGHLDSEWLVFVYLLLWIIVVWAVSCWMWTAAALLLLLLSSFIECVIVIGTFWCTDAHIRDAILCTFGSHNSCIVIIVNIVVGIVVIIGCLRTAIQHACDACGGEGGRGRVRRSDWVEWWTFTSIRTQKTDDATTKCNYLFIV